MGYCIDTLQYGLLQISKGDVILLLRIVLKIWIVLNHFHFRLKFGSKVHVGPIP